MVYIKRAIRLLILKFNGGKTWLILKDMREIFYG